MRLVIARSRRRRGNPSSGGCRQIDCFVAALLAMTRVTARRRSSTRRAGTRRQMPVHGELPRLEHAGAIAKRDQLRGREADLEATATHCRLHDMVEVARRRIGAAQVGAGREGKKSAIAANTCVGRGPVLRAHDPPVGDIRKDGRRRLKTRFHDRKFLVVHRNFPLTDHRSSASNSFL